MQESVKNVKILNALLTDHSSLFCSFLKLTNTSRGRRLWKFNNSLISNTKTLIQKVIFGFENDTYLTDQVKWELLKYEIRKFAINFSKKLAQNSRKLQRGLETKIKNLEQNIINEDKFNEYKFEKMNLKIFTITLLLESKCEINVIGINTVKNLLTKSCECYCYKVIKNDI